MPLDTVDLEDLANAFGDDFVAFTTKGLMTGIVAQVPWLAAGGSMLLPMVEDGVRWLVKYLGHNLGLIAFQFNTFVWTSDQAKDYIAAVEKANSMPDDISDEDWMKIDEERMHSFGNLYNLKR